MQFITARVFYYYPVIIVNINIFSAKKLILNSKFPGFIQGKFGSVLPQ